MGERNLRLALVASALVALAPALAWVAAELAGATSDRWLTAYTASSVTVPIALGLAAMAFATHGLTLQRAVADQLEANLEDVVVRTERAARDALVSAPAGTARTGNGSTATAVMAPAPASTAVATADEEERGDGSALTDKGKAAAAKAGKKAGRKAQARAKREAKSRARAAFRGLTSGR